VADRRLVRAVPVTVVLLVVVVGMILIAFTHWRRGAAVLGIAAWVGALLRLTVRDAAIGPLGVRGRTFDVVFFATFGLLLTLATTLGF
jgi:hypothetical protein